MSFQSLLVTQQQQAALMETLQRRQQQVQVQQQQQQQVQVQQQQVQVQVQQQQHEPNEDQRQIIQQVDGFEEFKADVRTWLELDNSIKRLQAAMKERRAAKKALTDRILAFMNRHNIDDLRTKDGRLRYKVSYVRVPLSQQMIKERISTYFSANPTMAQALSGTVFGNRERTEKTALVRR